MFLNCFHSELLLFLLELTQIKAAIISHYRELFATNHSRNYSEIQEGIERAIESITYKIEIAPQILSLSDNVYREISIDKAIQLWYYLYEQYVDLESDSPINISHTVRTEIEECLKKYDCGFVAINTSNNNKQMPKTLKLPLPQHQPPSVSISESANTNALDYKLESHHIIMELINSFDHAAREVYNLLASDPWLRFKTTDEFQTWKLQFFDK